MVRKKNVCFSFLCVVYFYDGEYFDGNKVVGAAAAAFGVWRVCVCDFVTLERKKKRI